ncbi:hypothetical protein PTTG_26037 [Puccinia triticina 1-1 BBBD Race 1]|uniref:Uncharacterized protein n=2 Tax=Puccinia triticina TaxID=208348 RepID=A0A180GYQ1_PUCT1|nr:uncharacterized protein PtA15_9A677 [Puccinia triticina]OAV97382.1 hypothetical protein PTTG_26037 [Puccinia triticina 1-1 BBBD Race 1]WAQ88550.1 hypothetical protein PtA15_9A677 [Puccinia triticina]
MSEAEAASGGPGLLQYTCRASLAIYRPHFRPSLQTPRRQLTNMNSTYLLRGILLLAHLLHDRASAAYRGREVEEEMSNSIELSHAPLIKQSVPESSGQLAALTMFPVGQSPYMFSLWSISLFKGKNHLAKEYWHFSERNPKVHQSKISGEYRVSTWELTKTLAPGQTSSPQKPVGVDKELRKWLDDIYNYAAGASGFLSGRCKEPQSFRAYAETIDPVRKLMKQLKKDPRSPHMAGLLTEVLEQIFVLSGKNDAERVVIAACAKALADVTQALQLKAESINIEKWHEYMKNPDNSQVVLFLYHLQIMWFPQF